MRPTPFDAPSHVLLDCLRKWYLRSTFHIVEFNKNVFRILNLMKIDHKICTANTWYDVTIF